MKHYNFPFFKKKFLIWFFLILWWWGGPDEWRTGEAARVSLCDSHLQRQVGERRSNGELDVSLFKTSWTHIFEMSRTETE